MAKFRAIWGFVIASAVLPAFGQDHLLAWMDRIAQEQLNQREKAVAQIRTVEQAKARQQEVRRRVLRILGGLPDYDGPLQARMTGTIDAGEYQIEKVLFQSLPGYFVTANVYRPSRAGRYPAVLLQSGHTQEGKVEPQVVAANLALQGFVAMTFDPVGQGEREQTYLPMLGRALAGGSVNEHLAAGAQSILIGQSVARYFIHDAKRAIDYLRSRPDVDGDRIGAAGCSGGGALTTYTGALDERVKAAAPGCSISTFHMLFTGPTPDSEMALPAFLASGLDAADFYEMSAPKAWLLLATKEDYFTPAAALPVYEETRRWFGFHKAEDRIRYAVAPGPHGTPLESREEIYAWMAKWLKGSNSPVRERPVRQYTNLELRVTATGNVANEPGSVRLHEILRRDREQRFLRGTAAELLAELRSLNIVRRSTAPAYKPIDPAERDGILIQQIQFEAEPGVPLQGNLYVPRKAGRKPAVLVVQDKSMPQPLFVSRSRATAGLAESLARMGQVVLEMEPRDSPAGYDGRPFVGNWVTNARALLIARNLPALRASDLIRGIETLAAHPEVDASEIRGAARGVKGFWLLMAAVADDRIRSVWLDRAPYSLAAAFDRPIGNALFDATIPGFALRWDMEDLVKALGKRTVFWSDPVDWMNQIVTVTGGYRYRYSGENDDTLAAEFLRK